MADVVHACTVGELLSAYLDAELTNDELEAVVSHLDTCLDCIAEFHELREARTMLRTMPRLEVPDRALPDIHYKAELSAYLDGELPTAEQPVVFAHMAFCTECRNELYELDGARIAIRALPRLDPVLHQATDGDVGVVVPISRRRISWFVVGAAAAAFVAFVSFSTSSPQGPTVNLDSFLVQHDARFSVQSPLSLLPSEATFVSVSSP